MRWSDYRKLKRARQLVDGTRKLLRIQRDTLEQPRIAELTTAANALAEAVADRNVGLVGPQALKLETQLDKTFPQPKDGGLRENVEVLLVAVIVAMAVRTFFIQPFKIPTGSMQPTLFGITQEPDCDRGASFVQRWSDIVLSGKWPVGQRATLLQGLGGFLGWGLFGRWPDGGVCVLRGDHIFVDKFTYHFRKPKRGEVVVFATDNVPALSERARGKFYIKRLIGLPHDTIQIKPPYVVVNGQILDERPAFQRIYSMANGYHGYVFAPPSTE